MKKHILLVEDEPAGYRAFMEALSATGIDCKVTYTASYDHALQLLEFLVPDCVFMRRDEQGKKSFVCLHRIRQHPLMAEAPVIIYANEVSSAVIAEALRNGADYCIDHPQGLANLSLLLNDVFHIDRQRM